MEVNNGFKQTEIGLIPNDWELFNLGKSSTLKARIGWQGLTTAEYLNSGHYYLITGTDFKDGYIDWDNCVYVEKERYVQDKNIQVKVEDILVTKDGTIGKVAFVDKVPKKTTLNSGVFVVRPMNKIYNSRYLYYILMSEYFKEFLNRLTAGSTISHLYQKDFVFFEFPKPTLKEQTAIATSLSDTDAWINNLEQLLTKKRQIKQGAMQELLQPNPEASGGWEVNIIGKVFNFKQGVQCAINNQKFENNNGFKRFIRIVDLTQVSELPRYISDPGIVHHVSKTDLFMVRYGNPGLLGYGYEGVVANNLFRLIPLIKIESDFFFHLLSFKNEEILQLSSSTTMAALNFTSLKNLILSFPKDIAEQTRIASILSDMDEEIGKLESKLEKAKQLKQGMMQELLTGRIRLV